MNISCARQWLHRLWPSVCCVCEHTMPVTGLLCAACRDQIRWFKQDAPHPLGLSIDAYHAAAPFEEPLRSVIHQLKYHRLYHLAETLAAQWISHWGLPPDSFDVVTAVPISYWKDLRRGYNQSHLLAERIARHFQKPFLPNLVRRRWRSSSQTHLSREKRFVNASRSYYWKGHPTVIRHKNVLIIDDVCTTGATLQSAALQLRKGGARTVVAATLAFEESR